MKKKLIGVILILVLTLSIGTTAVYAGGGNTEMQLGIGAMLVTSELGKEIRIYSNIAANISKLEIKDTKYSSEFNVSIITFRMKIDILSAEAFTGDLKATSIFCDGNTVYFIGDTKQYENLMVTSADGFKYLFKNGKLEYMSIPIEQPAPIYSETELSK